VAAVTGYALGGGCELALCADIRIAGAGATLGQPEVLLGIIPGAGGTQRLTRLVGPAKAKDIIFTGRFVPAEEALTIGLVDKVVPDDQVYDAALTWARQFVAGPAVALRAHPVRSPVHHRGPGGRDAVVHRGRSGEGDVLRPLTRPSRSDRPDRSKGAPPIRPQ
jgi:1,4-dihydroxy-2-naphthoyl-CoA synthase